MNKPILSLLLSSIFLLSATQTSIAVEIKKFKKNYVIFYVPDSNILSYTERFQLTRVAALELSNNKYFAQNVTISPRFEVSTGNFSEDLKKINNDFKNYVSKATLLENMNVSKTVKLASSKKSSITNNLPDLFLVIPTVNYSRQIDVYSPGGILNLSNSTYGIGNKSLKINYSFIEMSKPNPTFYSNLVIDLNKIERPVMLPNELNSYIDTEKKELHFQIGLSGANMLVKPNEMYVANQLFHAKEVYYALFFPQRFFYPQTIQLISSKKLFQSKSIIADIDNSYFNSLDFLKLKGQVNVDNTKNEIKGILPAQ